MRVILTIFTVFLSKTVHLHNKRGREKSRGFNNCKTWHHLRSSPLYEVVCRNLLAGSSSFQIFIPCKQAFFQNPIFISNKLWTKNFRKLTLENSEEKPKSFLNFLCKRPDRCKGHIYREDEKLQRRKRLQIKGSLERKKDVVHLHK